MIVVVSGRKWRSLELWPRSFNFNEIEQQKQRGMRETIKTIKINLQRATVNYMFKY